MTALESGLPPSVQSVPRSRALTFAKAFQACVAAFRKPATSGRLWKLISHRVQSSDVLTRICWAISNCTKENRGAAAWACVYRSTPKSLHRVVRSSCYRWLDVGLAEAETISTGSRAAASFCIRTFSVPCSPSAATWQFNFLRDCSSSTGCVDGASGRIGCQPGQ